MKKITSVNKHAKIKSAHLVGIKGVAMAALALYLSDNGIQITGSDVSEKFPTDEELEVRGIRIDTGFDGTRILKYKPDVLYYTGAHGGRDNVEVQAAIQAGIPVYPHGQALGMIMRGSRQIVVSGSHGKTTTSAMIATILENAKLHPSYAIGCGSISGVGVSGKHGIGPWFVAEGDEYITDPHHDMTPRFLWLEPEVLVVTNIDFDHPDAYPNLTAVQGAFRSLQEKSKITIINADDPNSRLLRHGPKVISYGFSPAADYRITHVGVGDERMFFTLEERGISVGEFSLKVPGQHNVSNAVAAIIAAHIAGVGWDTIRSGLLTFTGTKRRFEKLKESKGIVWYDDYAHHPAEILATLKGVREWYPNRRIIAIFQPHTYSRTKALLTEFSHAFSSANMMIITDIYASAREHDTLGIDGSTLVTEASRHHSNILYAKGEKEVEKILANTVQAGDVVIFMGAGDIYGWGRKICNAFVTK